MGRKPTGQTTTVVRVPIRFKQKVQQYVQSLKQSELTEQVEVIEQDKTPEQAESTEQPGTPVALAIVERAGLIDLCKIAESYGINYLDQQGRCLGKEELRAKILHFFRGYINITTK
ncbi:MAG TPA: hypothetical protein V6D14_10050 [Coleofasciculaceae cyanobacterium]|jgi:predicted transcriptional regulator